MKLRFRTARALAGPLLLSALSLALMDDETPPPELMLVGTRYGNQVLVPSNQLVNPAGRRVEFTGWPIDIALAPQNDRVALLLHNRILIFSLGGQIIRNIATAPSGFMGLAYLPDGRLVSSHTGTPHSVNIYDPNGTAPPEIISVPTSSAPAGLAINGSGDTIFVALNRNNKIARVDLATRQIVATVNVGVAPLGVALTPQGDRLFVTNWGGRRTMAGEPSARSSGTPVLVDQRGIASSGTVSVVDVASFQVIAEIPVGLHPGGVRISPDGAVAAVANANSDTVTLIDTSSLDVRATIPLQALPAGYSGASPTALAFSPDGQWLYVTCSGNNAVALLEREDQAYAFRGYAPTDWYPLAVAVAPAEGGGETVFVANAKGTGSRNFANNFSVLAVRGTLTMFPGRAVDAAWPEQASFANNPFRNAPTPGGSPQNLGQLGIQHVFLVIKENRTYDQVLGDLGRGNGDPDLAIYGADVTPNQHELATQFVTLDNFYTSGIRSADGHQWLTQAMVTDYLERGYGNLSRSYPFWGDDPLAFASSGFIWNHARAAGHTVRIFGEFAIPYSGHTRPWREYYQDSRAQQLQMSVLSQSPVAEINTVLDRSFPGYTMNIPDVFRARIFIERLRLFEQLRVLPNLTILLLPTDHTAGLTPNYPTPRAMVADNDLAVGQVVEAITKSQFWPKSAIFVVEDDSQDGVDHVDGHRTVCFVVSPFARRGVVDSTHYNQTSVLRTIEEILGLAPMNKFDAAALPMRSVFVSTPDLRPFQFVPSRIALDQMNSSPAGLSGEQREAVLDSMAMDWSRPDAAPEERLNRILWYAERGWKSRYPHVPHRANCAREIEE